MWDKFHGYLCELEASFVKLAELLHRKLVALEKFDIIALDEIIKEEQAFVLFTRSFDKNVESFRNQLGFTGQRLSEVIEELPEEEQPRFRVILQKLTTALDEAKALNLKCQDLTQERLYSLDKAIKELDHTPGSSYGKPGGDSKRPGDPPPQLFTKSI